MIDAISMRGMHQKKKKIRYSRWATGSIALFSGFDIYRRGGCIMAQISDGFSDFSYADEGLNRVHSEP